MKNQKKYKIITSKEGLPTLIVKKEGKEMALHSKFFPSRENESYREKINPQKFDILIILGFGLGYHLQDLKEKSKFYKKIIVFDIYDFAKDLVVDNPKTSFFLSLKNTVFFCGKTESEIKNFLSQEIDLEDSRGLQVLEHLQSMRIFPEYYSPIKNIIKEIVNKKISSEATKKAFGFKFFKNNIFHFKNRKNLKNPSIFLNKFTNYNALIIGSAPSLNSYFEILKKVEDQFFIIAVDSALPVLNKKGIRVDFLISIDPQAYVFEHIMDTNFSGALIGSFSSNHFVTEKSNSFLFLNSHPICQIIDNAFPKRIPFLESKTGTVAGEALLFAQMVGFQKIGFIGFDFCFPKYEIYAKGTSYQKRYSMIFNNRFSSVESKNMDYVLVSNKKIKVEDKFTRKNFLGYRDALSNFAETNFLNNLFNINDLGLKIDGVPNRSFDEFTKDVSKIENKKSFLQDLILEAESLSFLDGKIILEIANNKKMIKELYEASSINKKISLEKITKILKKFLGEKN